MQIADSDICLSHYKIDIEKDDKGNTMPIGIMLHVFKHVLKVSQ